jgi:hypothetical protein
MATALRTYHVTDGEQQTATIEAVAAHAFVDRGDGLDRLVLYADVEQLVMLGVFDDWSSFRIEYPKPTEGKPNTNSRKLDVVRTAEELDKLPIRAVVLDSYMEAYQKYSSGWRGYDNGPMSSAIVSKFAPLKVVWVPIDDD